MKSNVGGSVNDLKDRVVFTLLILIVYRFGAYIPIAGINHESLLEFANANQNGILGIFNVLSGGSLARMSIFALSIFPYITASIVVQLMTFIYKPLSEMKKDGESGRKKVNQIARLLTVVLASVQSYGTATLLLKTTTSTGSIVVINSMFFTVSTVSTLVVGTMLIMWLGEQISARGIGNGASLIIFTGIVSGVPGSIASLFELTRRGSVSIGGLFAVVCSVMILIAVIVFIEKSHRKVAIHYPKRQVGNKIYSGESTYLPLKINTAGVIPPIFATSLLLFPITIANFTGADSAWGEFVHLNLTRGKPVYMLCTAVLIVVLSFVYTAIVFDSTETANNLRKYGAYVQGRRPGEHTAEFFDYLLSRLSVLGAAYLCVICLVPEFLASQMVVASALSGTSMLIIVNVVLDTFAQAQSYVFSSKYESAIKKIKLK